MLSSITDSYKELKILFLVFWKLPSLYKLFFHESLVTCFALPADSKIYLSRRKAYANMLKSQDMENSSFACQYSVTPGSCHKPIAMATPKKASILLSSCAKFCLIWFLVLLLELGLVKIPLNTVLVNNGWIFAINFVLLFGTELLRERLLFVSFLIIKNLFVNYHPVQMTISFSFTILSVCLVVTIYCFY